MADNRRTGTRTPQRKPPKAERREVKDARRKKRGRGGPAEVLEDTGNAVVPADLESRLSRIEGAAASQASRSEELLKLVGSASALKEGAERALLVRRENVIPVREPLALVCQAQRSGGTLLARLFDGHPQCHAHPHELHIGERRPHTWPDFSLDESPDLWLDKLREEYIAALFHRGRRVIPLKTPDRPHQEPGRHPFILPPELQRLIFLDEVERRAPISSEREILDCYMTALFNAWLDNQNLYTADKRWVVAFSPRRAWGDGLERYFQIYPDGRLISILRDPWGWYTSAQGRDPSADMDVLLDAWKRSAGEMLRASREHGEQFCVVRFEELVLDTPKAMTRLADFLDIEYTPTLAVPTFNSFPVGANSSFETTEVGVVTDPVERAAKLLSDEQRERITSACAELYEDAQTLSAPDAAPSSTS
jgi:hypothetical protein